MEQGGGLLDSKTSSKFAVRTFITLSEKRCALIPYRRKLWALALG